MTFPLAARGALLACAFLALAPAAQAQPADTTAHDLAALLARALDASPELRAARLEAAARAQTGRQAGALPDPMVSVTAFPYPLVTALGAQRTQWRVEQQVPWPGTLALRARSADLAAQSAALDAEALALDLTFEVKRAYYALYRVQRVDALVRAFRRRLDAFAEAATVRYEVGRGPQAAVLRVRLEHERLAALLIELDHLRDAATQTLARLLDRPDLELADTLALTHPALPSHEALAALTGPRPEIEASDVAVQRAEAEAALARKARYPDLGLAVTYFDVADRAAPPTANGRDALAVMLSARVPLQRGRLAAAVEESRLRAAQAEARRGAVMTAVATEQAEARHAVHHAAASLRLYRERLLPHAEAVVSAATAAYATGEADYAALLDAERARFEVQRGELDALGRYLDATALLERAFAISSLP